MTKSINGEQAEQDRFVNLHREDLLWEKCKANGSDHYKTGGIEPIDLYRAGGMLRSFALCSIMKYAFRNRNDEEPISIKDMNKIIDYAQKLKAAFGPDEGGAA